MNKPVVIVGAIVAACGALVAVWLLWWQPKQDREAVGDQVISWEVKWDAARACLLGEHPLSTDAADALALAELTSGQVAGKQCTDPIKKIVRAPGEPLGDDVEAAFREVEAAIPAVAKAYALRYSAQDDEIDRRVADLGVAIAALDAADDHLREVAGLPRHDRPGGGAVIARVEPVAVPELLHDPDAAGVASVPGGAWMVAPVPARTFDPHAKELEMAFAALPAAATLDDITGAVKIVSGEVAPLAALGAGDERAVPVKDQSGGLTLYASADGGKHWEGNSWVTGTITSSNLDATHGKLDVVLEAFGNNVWYTIDAAHPTALPAGRDTDIYASERLCRGAGTDWLLGDDHVESWRGASLASMPITENEDRAIIGCTGDALLVEDGTAPVTFERCRGSKCEEAMRGTSYAFGRAALLDDGAVVYVASRGALIAKWSENAAAPAYYKLPRAMTLTGVTVEAGVPTARLEDSDGKMFTAALK